MYKTVCFVFFTEKSAGNRIVTVAFASARELCLKFLGAMTEGKDSLLDITRQYSNSPQFFWIRACIYL